MANLLLLSILVVLSILLIIGILHYAFKAPRLKLAQTPSNYSLEFETHRIATVAGKSLNVWWIEAEASDVTVLLLHGWGSGASQLLPLATPFHEAGYNVCMLDARNHGQSDGHGFSSLPRFAEDAESVLLWLKQERSASCHRLVLVGHSVGAGACLLVASRREDISGVVSLAAFSHPEFVMRSFLSRWPFPEVFVRLVLRYVQWVIGFRFDDIAPVNSIRKIKVPVLLVHGDADTTVPLQHSRDIFANAAHDEVELLVIPGAGHDSVDKIEDHGHEITGFLKKAL